MKWTVRENGNNVCPGLRLEDLPNKIPANMHILHNNGMLSIASENIAGVLPCKNGHEKSTVHFCTVLDLNVISLYSRRPLPLPVRQDILGMPF